jgi:hypothetical protein
VLATGGVGGAPCSGDRGRQYGPEPNAQGAPPHRALLCQRLRLAGRGTRGLPTRSCMSCSNARMNSLDRIGCMSVLLPLAFLRGRNRDPM